jgi:hypothetical protein
MEWIEKKLNWPQSWYTHIVIGRLVTHHNTILSTTTIATYKTLSLLSPTYLNPFLIPSPLIVPRL